MAHGGKRPGYNSAIHKRHPREPGSVKDALGLIASQAHLAIGNYLTVPW